jgi:hypothetical protein
VRTKKKEFPEKKKSVAVEGIELMTCKTFGGGDY